MSRAATGDVVIEKPRNNIYTALVWIAVLAEAVGLFLLVQRSIEIFGDGKGIFS